MNKTPIEWTDFTVNPFRFRNLETGKVGHHCTKISPGCANCYSSKMQSGPYLSGLTFIAQNRPKGEFFLDEAALQQVLRRKKPARIFWEDMSDLFLEDYSDEWIDRCFAVMALTPHLTHQVLTKRPVRMVNYMCAQECSLRKDQIDEASCEFGACHANLEQLGRWPLPNIWLGVSVEDQQRADERIPLLLATPAALRFVSYEPALGPVDFRSFIGHHITHGACVKCGVYHPATLLNGCKYQNLDEPIDWVIVGGESGPGARPFDIAWARQTVAQCKAAVVPVFVKQLGADPREGNANGNCRNVDCTHPDCGYIKHRLKDRKGGDMAEWPKDLRIRELPEARA